jgi:cob(I)alamin adenosyltransferase
MRKENALLRQVRRYRIVFNFIFMSPERKIYTKTGDLGETSLLGGTRVKKSHLQVEAYGTIDELNSFIGLICDQKIHQHYREILKTVQVNLFVAEALVAADEPHPHDNLPVLKEDFIIQLEKEIDEMNLSLPDLAHFVLPGGDTTVSYCHVARTVCRRAERTVIRLADQGQTRDMVIKYLNRLSDYLFVLSRKIAKDNNAAETYWIP